MKLKDLEIFNKKFEKLEKTSCYNTSAWGFVLPPFFKEKGFVSSEVKFFIIGNLLRTANE